MDLKKEKFVGPKEKKSSHTPMANSEVTVRSGLTIKEIKFQKERSRTFGLMHGFLGKFRQSKMYIYL